MYSFVPEDRLQEIELDPLHTRELVLADGRQVRWLIGSALFTVPELRETMPCPVIFAPKDSLYLLGATALENFAVDVDPAEKKLKPIAAIIGGFLTTRQALS